MLWGLIEVLGLLGFGLDTRDEGSTCFVWRNSGFEEEGRHHTTRTRPCLLVDKRYLTCTQALADEGMVIVFDACAHIGA